MVGSKFISNLFNKNKSKKMLSKLRKMKKEYDILDKQVEIGKISNNDLNKYYTLKEEMNKMAKKFMLKDGKFVLKTEQKEGKTMENENKKDNVQKNMAANDINNNVNSVEQIKAEQEAQLRAQQQAQVRAQQQAQQEAQVRAQQQAQVRAQQQAQVRAQQQAQVRAQQQAQQEAQLSPEQINQIRAEQQAQQQAQVRAQQHARHKNNKNQESQHPVLTSVFLVVSDLPELSLKIKKSDIIEFSKAIETAMIKGIPFAFGPVVVNGRKILMYRFE